MLWLCSRRRAGSRRHLPAQALRRHEAPRARARSGVLARRWRLRRAGPGDSRHGPVGRLCGLGRRRARDHGASSARSPSASASGPRGWAGIVLVICRGGGAEAALAAIRRLRAGKRGAIGVRARRRSSRRARKLRRTCAARSAACGLPLRFGRRQHGARSHPPGSTASLAAISRPRWCGAVDFADPADIGRDQRLGCRRRLQDDIGQRFRPRRDHHDPRLRQRRADRRRRLEDALLGDAPRRPSAAAAPPRRARSRRSGSAASVRSRASAAPSASISVSTPLAERSSPR